MYSIVYYSSQPKKFLKKLVKSEFFRVVNKLEELANNPQSKNLNIKKLNRPGNFWRIRIRKIRAIYSIREQEKIILIVEIDFRGNVY